MKVSDLIKILEEHRDKEFYHLNMGNPIEVKTLNHHIVGDYFFLSDHIRVKMYELENGTLITQTDSI